MGDAQRGECEGEFRQLQKTSACSLCSSALASFLFFNMPSSCLPLTSQLQCHLLRGGFADPWICSHGTDLMHLPQHSPQAVMELLTGCLLLHWGSV